MRLHLTDAAVSSLSSENQLDVYDTMQRRFGVRVSKTAKTFFVFAGHPRKRIALGRYPNTSLKEARKAAQRHLLDPVEAVTTITLGEAKKTYFTSYIEPNYRTRTQYVTKRLFSLVAKLDHKPLSDLTNHDFTTIFDKLSPSQANHLFGVLRTFFGWCERRDYIAASPIRKLTKPHKEKDRTRVLTDAELVAIWNACEDDSFGKIVRMLILTGQRRGEIAALESGWTADGTITFPPHITKNGEEHTIPLAQNAQSLLAEALREDYSVLPDQGNKSNSTILFPSPKTGKVLIGFQKMKRELDKRCGVKNWTLHDLRRTFSTRCAELGVMPHIVERCLNHLTGEISPLARRYNHHTYVTEMKAAFDLWDAHISRLISPQSSD